jgi:hypothetical protein
MKGVFHIVSRADAAGWKALYAHYADIVIAPSTAVVDCAPGPARRAGLIIPELWKPQPIGRRVIVS